MIWPSFGSGWKSLKDQLPSLVNGNALTGSGFMSDRLLVFPQEEEVGGFVVASREQPKHTWLLLSDDDAVRHFRHFVGEHGLVVKGMRLESPQKGKMIPRQRKRRS